MKKILFMIIIILPVIFFNRITFADKIYLDITQPGIKKIHMALEGFDIIEKVFITIKEDLEFTEYFEVYGPFPLKEDKFQSSFWQSSNVDIVMQAKVDDKITIKAYFVSNNSPFFVKDYELKNNEQNGHFIASEIYKILTGKEAPFFNRIVFVRKFKENMGIFIANWNGKTIYDTGIRREIISRVLLRGNRILFSSLKGRYWSIELFDLSTKKNTELIKSKELLQLGDIIDNNQFIYLAYRDDFSEIKITDLNGKSRTLSTSRWVESSPRWSPLGIFFVSNRAGSPNIYLMRENMITQRITYQGKYNTEPAINPESNMLAYSSQEAGFQIYTLDLLSNQLIKITHKGNNEQPSFCPDGHFLTIMSDRRGKREIYLISSNGFIQKPLTYGYLPYCSR